MHIKGALATMKGMILLATNRHIASRFIIYICTLWICGGYWCTIWLTYYTNNEYISEHRCVRINMVSKLKYFWLSLNTSQAWALCINTYVCTNPKSFV